MNDAQHCLARIRYYRALGDTVMVAALCACLTRILYRQPGA